MHRTCFNTYPCAPRQATLIDRVGPGLTRFRGASRLLRGGAVPRRARDRALPHHGGARPGGPGPGGVLRGGGAAAPLGALEDRRLGRLAPARVRGVLPRASAPGLPLLRLLPAALPVLARGEGGAARVPPLQGVHARELRAPARVAGVAVLAKLPAGAGRA